VLAHPLLENAMVHVDDVRAAYKLILGRDPENEEVLEAHAEQARSLEELRHIFLHSSEFRNHFPGPPPVRPLIWPPIDVQVDSSDAQLLAMMNHIEANWAHIGFLDPHWSVCTAEPYRASNIANTENLFYESGHDGPERLQRTAERCAVDLQKFDRCFELGCGVGRMSIWLAGLFRKVVAGDISRPHLEIARQALARAFSPHKRGARSAQFVRCFRPSG
jgi:hypothetical protein